MAEDIMDIMGITLDNIKQLAGGGNIMGEAVRLDRNTVVIPYCKVSLGFVCAEGGQRANGEGQTLKLPYAGGGGGGVTLTPCGFLIAENGEYKTISQTDEGEDNKWSNLIKAIFGVMKKS